MPCKTRQKSRAGISFRPFLHHFLHQRGPALLRERLLHGRDRSVLHVRQDVGVGVHRLRYGGVPEHLLDYLGIRAFTEKDRGAGVPEVVEPYPGEPGSLQERPEGAVGEVAHVHGRPDGRSENEVILPPEGAGGESLLQLALTVILKGGYGVPCKGNNILDSEAPRVSLLTQTVYSCGVGEQQGTQRNEQNGQERGEGWGERKRYSSQTGRR